MFLLLKLLYGPYEANGVIKHRTQKVRGLVKSLEDADFNISLEATFLLNRIQLLFGNFLIFSGDIREIRFNEECKDDAFCGKVVDAALHFRNKMQSYNTPSHYPHVLEGMRAAHPRSYIHLEDCETTAHRRLTKVSVMVQEPEDADKVEQFIKVDEPHVEDPRISILDIAAPNYRPQMYDTVPCPATMKKYVLDQTETVASSSSSSSMYASPVSSITVCTSCHGVCPPPSAKSASDVSTEVDVTFPFESTRERKRTVTKLEDEVFRDSSIFDEFHAFIQDLEPLQKVVESVEEVPQEIEAVEDISIPQSFYMAYSVDIDHRDVFAKTLSEITDESSDVSVDQVGLTEKEIKSTMLDEDETAREGSAVEPPVPKKKKKKRALRKVARSSEIAQIFFHVLTTPPATD